MIRSFGLWGAFVAIPMLAAPGLAEAPGTYCPRGPVTVYFASGAATATPQIEALIGKIGDTATTCEADRVDLVAHIDPGVDGEEAASLALERLKMMMKDLVAHGLPADRIRLSAQAPMDGEPSARFSQVEVVFRKGDPDEPAPWRGRIATDPI
jgi:hypothetical protein